MAFKRAARIMGWVILGLAAGVVLGLVLGLIVMWLWNWLMPTIFGLPKIGYWQAVGLFILCHMLLKSHSDHGHCDEKGQRHFGTHFAIKLKKKIESDFTAHKKESSVSKSDVSTS